MKKVFVIGDSHFPFACLGTLGRIYEAVKRERPDAIVQVGDLYDHYSTSRFPIDPNVMTPKQELLEGREMAERMWQALRKLAPKAECYQLLGNHDVRPKKRVLELVPAVAHLLKTDDLYRFQGISTLKDERRDLEIDGVVYEHGYTGFGKHMLANMKPTVTGHLHLGGAVFLKMRNRLLWELNAGFVGLEHSVPLSYGYKIFTKWTRGYGVVDERGPRFCPLEGAA